jgi:hypothetical protein
MVNNTNNPGEPVIILRITLRNSTKISGKTRRCSRNRSEMMSGIPETIPSLIQELLRKFRKTFRISSRKVTGHPAEIPEVSGLKCREIQKSSESRTHKKGDAI